MIAVVFFHIYKIFYVMLFSAGLFHIFCTFWCYPKTSNFDKYTQQPPMANTISNL